MPDEYAVIDIETTGRTSKITDIAVIIYDGEKIIEEFQTLVNPQAYIPDSITQLTGITNEMVSNAPQFREIANQILDITEGRVFVAHNVAFDYGVIRSEFARLGESFDRKKLCTVKLSRKLLPSHTSYSLGKLCSDLNIPINGRHRAYGDAVATVQLMNILLHETEILGIKDLSDFTYAPKIPSQLDKKLVTNLPEANGLYYFDNDEGKVIYLSRSNNIKESVLSHFASRKERDKSMSSKLASVRYELISSELIAKLVERSETEKYQPEFNTVSKNSRPKYGLYSYENQNGVLQLSIGKTRLGTAAICTFQNLTSANKFLEKTVKKYELCLRYCGLEKTESACFGFMTQKCKGVCCNKESVSDYNVRVRGLATSMTLKEEDFFIVEKGRTENEKGVIQIKNGEFVGLGYIPVHIVNDENKGYDQYITTQKRDLEAELIIREYLLK